MMGSLAGHGIWGRLGAAAALARHPFRVALLALGILAAPFGAFRLPAVAQSQAAPPIPPPPYDVERPVPRVALVIGNGAYTTPAVLILTWEAAVSPRVMVGGGLPPTTVPCSSAKIRGWRAFARHDTGGGSPQNVIMRTAV